MNLLSLENLYMLIFLAPPLLLSLTIHEFAHGRVALAFGDPTALRAGRLTLNPLKHLSLVGTLMLFVVGFGWAKPVPVNPYLMKPPRLGNIMVSLAGPLSNLGLAIICGCLIKIILVSSGVGLFDDHGALLEVLLQILLITLFINIMLCVFNLIPLAPLDGYHILGGLLPADVRPGYAAFQQQYGMFILLALLVGPGLLSNFSGSHVPDPIDEIFSIVEHLTIKLLSI